MELGPRVALLGIFDVADYGNLLLPRIFEFELRRRLPLARIHSYSPLGSTRPIALDGGRPARPLGRPDSRRKSEFAEQHDLVAVAGDVIHTRDELYAKAYCIPREEAEHLRPSGFFVDGLGPELEHSCPVAWHAVGVPFELDTAEKTRVKDALDSKSHVSVRDTASRERLLATGTANKIGVLPEPAVLVSRLVRPEVLRKRLDYLRVLGSYPESERPVAIEADASGAERDIADLVEEGVPVVLVELSAHEDAEVLAGGLPGPAFRLPTHASLEDRIAAIANARAFYGTSPAGKATALAFGVELLGDEDHPVRYEVERRLDAEFDAIAELVERSWAQRASAEEQTPAELARALAEAEERYEALRSAHQARGDRIVTERLRLAEIIDRLEEVAGGLTQNAAIRIAELENAVFTAEAEAAQARYELERLQTERARHG